jgi:hypothetical protein
VTKSKVQAGAVTAGLLERWVILVANSSETRCRKASIFCSAVLPHLAAKVMNRAIKFG